MTKPKPCVEQENNFRRRTSHSDSFMYKKNLIKPIHLCIHKPQVAQFAAHNHTFHFIRQEK